YADAQRYRLGVNHHQITVNAHKCPVKSFHRDGMMRTDDNRGRKLHYHPNSYGEWEDSPEKMDPPTKITGDGTHWDISEDDNNYNEQLSKLINLMKDEKKDKLFGNTARNLEGAEEFIKIRHIVSCYKADPAYGEGVAKAANISMDKVKEAVEQRDW